MDSVIRGYFHMIRHTVIGGRPLGGHPDYVTSLWYHELTGGHPRLPAKSMCIFVEGFVLWRSSPRPE